MARPEHQGLAAIDDIAAEVSQIRQSVRILATRWRGRFHREDLNELSNILDMCATPFKHRIGTREPPWPRSFKREGHCENPYHGQLPRARRVR